MHDNQQLQALHEHCKALEMQILKVTAECNTITYILVYEFDLYSVSHLTVLLFKHSPMLSISQSLTHFSLPANLHPFHQNVIPTTQILRCIPRFASGTNLTTLTGWILWRRLQVIVENCHFWRTKLGTRCRSSLLVC